LLAAIIRVINAARRHALRCAGKFGRNAKLIVIGRSELTGEAPRLISLSAHFDMKITAVVTVLTRVTRVPEV